MFNILLTLFILKISYVISMNQTNGSGPARGDVEVADMGTYLVNLDKKILRMLLLPEHGGGDELLEIIEKFWNNFRLLDGLVALHEQPAFRPAKYVVEQECPKFVNEVFDVYTLQKIYNWNIEQFSAFKDNLLSILGLAQRFPDDFSRMKVDVETLFEKPP